PFQGDLRGGTAPPAFVLLGLGPGRYYPDFQARQSIFADELRRYRSFSAGASSTPYLRQPWLARMGPNRYLTARLRFARQWRHDPRLPAARLVIMQLYPWHTTSVTRPLRPPPTAVLE